MSDDTYLMLVGSTYYVQVAVPRPLVPAIGRRVLKKSLRTKSKAEANRLKRKELAALWTILEEARTKLAGDDVVNQGMAWRKDLQASGADGAAYEAISGLVIDRAYEIEESQGEDAAHAFADVAFGRATPLRLFMEEWLAEPGKRGHRRSRTQADYRRLMEELQGWLETSSIPATLEAVTRPVAGRYVSQLHRQDLSHARINTIISAFNSYWQWLRKRGHLTAESPWAGQLAASGGAKPTSKAQERPFNPDELVKLFEASPDQSMTDLMLMGALTGMRIEEICTLRVRDCADRVFQVPGTKTKAADRSVPIHPDLTSLVERRCEGRSRSDYLFHELTASTHGERSSAIGKRFGRYRAKAGVHARVEGGRRSKVNFHSFRRWFVTEAIRAGNPERVVKQLVGHAFDKDVTLQHYFSGDLPEPLRRCVESVRLPGGCLGKASRFPEGA